MSLHKANMIAAFVAAAKYAADNAWEAGTRIDRIASRKTCPHMMTTRISCAIALPAKTGEAMYFTARIYLWRWTSETEAQLKVELLPYGQNCLATAEASIDLSGARNVNDAWLLFHDAIAPLLKATKLRMKGILTDASSLL